MTPQPHRFKSGRRGPINRIKMKALVGFSILVLFLLALIPTFPVVHALTSTIETRTLQNEAKTFTTTLPTRYVVSVTNTNGSKWTTYSDGTKEFEVTLSTTFTMTAGVVSTLTNLPSSTPGINLGEIVKGIFDSFRCVWDILRDYAFGKLLDQIFKNKLLQPLNKKIHALLDRIRRHLALFSET